VDPDGVPLEAILIRYWEGHGNAIRSAEQARFALAKWSDHFAGATVAALTPQAQETFVEALRANGYQPSYISRILSVGRAALMRAWKRGELTSVPFIADVKRDLEHEAEKYRELDMDEMVRLLAAAARVPHLLRFCIISLNTLARPDAVLELSPAQVDIKRRLVKLNPDGRSRLRSIGQWFRSRRRSCLGWNNAMAPATFSIAASLLPLSRGPSGKLLPMRG
jgi:hypothetical protein